MIKTIRPMTGAKIVQYWAGGELIPHSTQIGFIPNEEFSERFPGVAGLAFSASAKWVYSFGGELYPIDRIIHYSRRPSLHKCDKRCTQARGYNCECSCGGLHHGAERRA